VRGRAIFLGAVLGGLAVAAGAFGAHALKDRLSTEALGWWATAAHYHLVHAVALVLVGVLETGGGSAADDPPAGSRALRLAGWGFVLGIALFSGSLYALALTGAKALGAVTPVGGLLLLLGWAALATAAVRRRP
jgi:uncharacterized membrane protein YgdD (TMEM256/DUF423 family)